MNILNLSNKNSNIQITAEMSPSANGRQMNSLFTHNSKRRRNTGRSKLRWRQQRIKVIKRTSGLNVKI
jgi:hypothetical protein